ncbi:MAG: HNH endonuclease [Alphaproteobacteria bacterium]|nr:HNH endonuclease [Alphaproteobacteria bacterium]
MALPFSGKQRWRRKRDEHDNVILDLLVNESDSEKKIYFLDITSLEKERNFDLKRQIKLLVRRLARQGAFQSFPIRDQKRAELYGQIPKGYEADFMIPPSLGGSYDIENICIVSKYISQLMYELYWKPLSLEVKRFIHKRDAKKTRKIGIKMPDFPRVFSQRAFLNFVLPQEREPLEKYLASKRAWRLDALKRVQVRGKKDYFVLRLSCKQRLPAGMKYVLVKARSVSLLEASKIKQAYLRQKEERVLACLERGDFNHLPKKIRESIKKTGCIPSDIDLTCHHIIPRALGGDNSIENMSWLDKEAHERIHKTYINPLVEYCDFLCEDGKKRDIYVEIPVPENAEIPQFSINKRFKIFPLKLPKFLQAKKKNTERS